MENKLRKIQKQLSILLALCMVFTQLIMTIPVFAAGNNGVTLTYVPSMLWGGFGQYVEYEMDGVRYRTDEASSAVNRLAWSRMTQEQRRQTYDRLYTTAARKAAFGEDGFADIVSWIRETNEWFVANRIWKGRIANRDFPELYQVFNENASLSTLYSDYDQLATYIIPKNVARSLEREEFDKVLADVELTYEIGRQFYQKAVDMRAKNIGAVASFTMMQCTQMLSDMLFVPSVVQGATVATSGMFADVTNVLLQVVGLDGGSIAEKVNSALGGNPVQLTLGEQVKLCSAMIETYATIAEQTKNELDGKMETLRNAYTTLVEHAKALEFYKQQIELEKQQAKESYQTNLDETFVSPPPSEPGESDEVYITLAFKWKTEAELRADLFNNNFDEWRQQRDSEGLGYEIAAQTIFAEVLKQKSFLDAEVDEKVGIICGMLMEAYNSANGKVEALEAELDTLQKAEGSDLPEDNLDLIRIPVNHTFFYGTDSFSPELEDFANFGLPYDDYYVKLQAHISEYQTKVAELLADANDLKGKYEGFYASIETDVQDVAFYLGLLESLRENYWALYNSAIWKIGNDPDKVDPSPNYDNCPQINPYNDEAGAAYRIDGFTEAIEGKNPPEEVYDPDALAAELVDVLAVTRPTDVYNQAYTLYQELSEIKEVLESAHSESLENDIAYKAGRTQYYEEMDAWLAAYKVAEGKMADALAEIKNITDAYEASWKGTFFLGGYDYYGYNPYLYNTSVVSISAFDVAGLRDYIRGGGNTATLYNKLKSIERQAEINEVVVADLIGQIGALDIEMRQLRNSTLDDYAASKETPCKNFYSLRIEYELDGKWGNLTRSSDDVLAYFNTCDIPRICDILKGESDDVLFLRSAIKEIRGYLDADTVATAPVSNRLYDIYKKATGIKDLYMSSSYDNYGLLTEEQRTELLNLYANPGDGDDIFNTMNSVRHKHEGVNYTFPPSLHDGVDQYSPVGEPTSTAALPGITAVQAPIYHPLAVGATSFTATLYAYDNGWSVVQTLSGTGGSLDGIIDTKSDMLTMPFTGLEDGRDYRVEWVIVHAPSGTALHEEGSHYFTYTAPLGVFTTVELNKETYDSADVTVTNNSGTVLSDQYIFLEGYDEDGNLVLSQRRPLSNLDTDKTTTVEFTFDEVVYTAEAYVAGEDGQTPATPARLEIEGGNSTIAVPETGEASNTSAPFTATVYDQYGEAYEGGTVDWSLSPQLEGVSISEDGIVTVTSAARAVISSDMTCTVTATLRGTTVSGTGVITVRRGAAIADQVRIQREALLFKDGDSDFISRPLGENSSKSYTYSAVLADQYGAEIASDPGDFTWSSAGADSGVTVNGNQVTIGSEAPNGSFTLTASHTKSTFSAQVTIYIVGEDVDVDWTAVEDKITGTSYTYGDRDDKAGPLGDGAATAGDTPLQGSFSYKDPAGMRNAGEQSITVIFTVTTPGDYQGLQLEHDVAVTVARREITGTLTLTGKAAVGETLTAVFTSEADPDEYDIVWLSGGSTVATAATYTVAAADRGRTITVKAVGKRNYTGEVAGETGISIPPADSETPGTGSGGGGGGGSTSTGPLPPQNEQDITAETTSGTTTTTVVDRVRLEAYVETAERGSGIVIPISENNTSTAQLPLNTFETMAEREMTLTVQSGAAAISIPPASIDFGAVKELFGPEAEHGDIPISITISQLSSGETAVLHSAAASEGLGILGTPVAFSVSASYNGKTVEVASFKQYVQRSLEVTQEIAENVSTALVFEEDNTFRPVPTAVYLEEGKYYVIVASRTNSTYVLVSHTVSFNDTSGRWYEDVVKEMAGRQIIRGIGNSTFAGDREITRAEFASIMVRALGLPAKGTSVFSDVPKDTWYNGAVAAAAKYEIVSGRGDNRFDPMAKITREEAMQMVFNASKLTPFNGIEKAVNSAAFSDYNTKSQWAAEAVDFNLTSGLIVGSNGKINPKANITRGEVAAVVLKLLQKAKLVND
ncbi:MAG: S-layer homology domain-containing protein [Dethiobacteria bacterium]